MLKADATVEEKSLALAELMNKATHREGFHSWWMPYADNERGLAQFAAILLEFPEVVISFVDIAYTGDIFLAGGVTQANILDEILRMNGKME